MIAKTAETAKREEASPLSRATPVASAVTAAEWELGIPPVLKIRDQSIFRVAIYVIGTFTNCAKKMAAREASSGKLSSISMRPDILSVQI
jgi:hypothetical protein